ncbi:hypothetical protein ACLOAU_00615 [Niabella sp. CJ426]|uniref:hypothetical protein n=1 Tax=Niabella sp. CJ426 TaxID=3393740 RepID=UPI003CFBCC70
MANFHPHITTENNNAAINKPYLHFYDQKITARADELINLTGLSVAEIILTCTSPPSNFSEFFREQTIFTPGILRKHYQQNILNYKKTEKFTIVSPFTGQTFVQHSLKN